MISLEAIRFSYGDGPAVIEQGQVEIGPGLSLLLGPNGCGKTTLLHLIAGIEKPNAGRILMQGFDLWEEEVRSRREIAYVPEVPDLTPYATVEEILRFVCRLRAEPPGRVREVLASAGLEGLGRRSVRQLSQGQRRRAVLAAAWIGAPRILLLDEPFEALDLNIRALTLRWLEDAIRDQKSVICGTHDIEDIASNAARVLTIIDGTVRVFEDLPASNQERLDFMRMAACGRIAESP